MGNKALQRTRTSRFAPNKIC
uniref:Uncharacterized protein n=1 Tax=Arundo donax TaxID=35708 RepID=A0A0A9AJN8_ARUDO